MARDEIVEGLRMALGRGESLLQAMMSFYNAGYLKKEVEEAAQLLNQPQLQTQFLTTPQQVQPTSQPLQTKALPVQDVSQYGSQTPPPQQFQQPNVQAPVSATLQAVSNYNEKGKHPMSTGLVIFLGIFLLILVSSLIFLLVFRESISAFLGKFF